ncbi:Polyketide cyclase / dehydrase and lipid transport [Streptoalloteichus tenebrarius]|uniref:Polyketide cyclase / dehydrase and lipid transport n=1 Tax=Streptoalloteichus tenebrarius (strain ATCC 17920 / DSM 40477 / JCM 4838 / CBS 697.72 / NBRC 16177 / NCIMB 11028 / NRRL B-12390 / A12253. 1 / ISP 5477) TaxID=1933 RepID=A0ABT1HMG8_STRSD|nr:SRPBCC family protein [Streptoalloteichus tenebrarius]MCP2256713.1 Polyketide cyclase / dehydrase and lipid transport [Streptoalloteichus tenebrarius]BFF00387.1 SRPBCC family protein [Streptoalloteichus tenebrarius]
MADQSTQSIVIDAVPEKIMAVIADFAAYPEWANGVKRTEVLAMGPDGRAAQVRFELDAGVVKDEYVLAYEWAPDGLSVSWHLVKGQMQKAQRGSYVLEPSQTGSGVATKVTYSLTVDLAIPMIGLFKRKAEKMIMDTALKELRRHVERAA